jgi:hypothetical protein
MIRYCAFCARKLPNRRELPPVFCSAECRTNGLWASIQAKELVTEWSSRRPSAFPPAPPSTGETTPVSYPSD